ncbi:MAG: hypothetical protein KIT84_08635 [Labilithrix sp.]|nr:hypothetical protein [Labilithrix sp.]MCW5811065.1 hypothetical protein [Labilithrix sp.]
MKRILGLAMAAMIAACNGVGDDLDGSGEQGGANANDRSSGDGDSERLETGAMAVSPTGDYIVARRNTTTLIVDVKSRSLVELDLAAERFLFAKSKDVVYVVLPSRAGVVALDLATTRELWRSTPIVAADASMLLARLSDDDTTILLADRTRVLFLDAATGDVRGGAASGPGMNDLEVLPGGAHALVVGDTEWRDGGPHTPVSLVPLDGSASTTIDVPNCAAPVAIVNGGTRALLSPTFCTADAQARAQGWSNPDPVSVIDIDPAKKTLSFRKNLPGFGPVALVGDGRAVAYLDMKRLDAAMFDDKSQIPPADAAQYHLMTIDPTTLAFDLHPIGDTLPRFAPSKDGKSLLVDASVSVVRSEASATATLTLDATGLKAEVKAGAFGDPSGSLFGVFTLATHTYTPFQGPAATLDRFVQQGDGARVYTLRRNGRGGDLFAIDLAARASFDLGRSLRDIAILPDGKTLVLRVRLASTAEGHLREQFCLSLDAQTCTASIDYQSPIPMHDP